MVNVLKATGEIEPFDEDKVITSIKRAGIPQNLHANVLSHVKEKIYDNIPTHVVYQHISDYLGNSPYPSAKAKYSLKQAIMALGPTGYPFEEFIAAVLQSEGYKTTVGSIVAGNCVTHEIDVIAEKEENNEVKRIMTEAKFHNRPGTRTDVHVALYTKARFEDTKKLNNFTDVALVTNTKVTLDVINYGLCAGMRIISWSYPKERSLRDLVERSNLMPITALTTISQDMKRTILENHVVLCRDLLARKDLLSLLSLSHEQIGKVLSEASLLSSL